MLSYKGSIKKYNMASRLSNIKDLYTIFKEWRSGNPDTFRIDGHDSIGPANPAQWIFFEISDFCPNDFTGKELGKQIDGTSWNGIYYFTASTRSESIDYFLSQYKKNDSVSSIFELSYTVNKAGIPSKRRLLLKGAPELINQGWFCKQYYKKY